MYTLRISTLAWSVTESLLNAEPAKADDAPNPLKTPMLVPTSPLKSPEFVTAPAPVYA